MKKLLTMCLILCSCIHTEPRDEVQFDFKIYEVDGKRMICEDPEKLYKKLRTCGGR